MKIFSLITLFALSTVSAELHYAPQNYAPQEQRRALRGEGGLNGCWGSFSQYGFCVEKITDPDDPTSDKVKMSPCNDMARTQMWKFDKDETELSVYYSHGGLLYNMDGGCLAIRGDVGKEKNLKVVECDRNNPKQHWLSDGDFLAPRDYRDFCVAPATYPIEPIDPVIVLPCGETDSLDY